MKDVGLVVCVCVRFKKHIVFFAPPFMKKHILDEETERIAIPKSDTRFRR